MACYTVFCYNAVKSRIYLVALLGFLSICGQPLYVGLCWLTLILVPKWRPNSAKWHPKPTISSYDGASLRSWNNLAPNMPPGAFPGTFLLIISRCCEFHNSFWMFRPRILASPLVDLPRSAKINHDQARSTKRSPSLPKLEALLSETNHENAELLN